MMRFDEIAHDRESEAGTGTIAVTRVILPVERLKDPLVCIGGDAYACIAYCDAGVAIFASEIERHAAPIRCVDQCILDQVHDYLLQPLSIAEDRDRAIDVE